MTNQIAARLKIWNRQECFTHIEGETGKSRTFLIGTMKEFIKDYPACKEIIHATVPIDRKIADYLRTNAGIEQPRLDRLVDPYLSEPIIGILWKNGETTVIDGNHRIVKMVEAGRSEIDCHLFRYPFWEHFITPDDVSQRLVADGALTGDSNVIAYEQGADLPFGGQRHVFYHGGAPDLTEILPPDATGAKTTADFGAKGVCRTDRVYVTTDVHAAQVFAAMHPSHRGTVYIVDPYGMINEDPDCLMPGLSFECEGAKVIQKKQLDFFLMQKLRREIMEDNYSHKRRKRL